MHTHGLMDRPIAFSGSHSPDDFLYIHGIYPPAHRPSHRHLPVLGRKPTIDAGVWLLWGVPFPGYPSGLLRAVDLCPLWPLFLCSLWVLVLCLLSPVN